MCHAGRGRLLHCSPAGPVPLGLAYVLLVENNPFSELVVIFPDYALRISLGTFSILLLKLKYKQFGLLSKLLASLMRNYFPKRPSGAPLHTLSKLYDVPVGFEPPPPILRLNIAYFAVAEGWLLLDIG